VIPLVDVDECVRLLNGGGVVAIPTDTVYGVGASLGHPKAVASLFTLKSRPHSVALPVMVRNAEAVAGLEVSWPERAKKLSDAFWPGALTIVVPVRGELASLLGSTDGTLGFRVPGDDTLLDVLTRCGPLAVTSANEHGQTPCHSAQEVRRRFQEHSELSGVLDGGVRSGEVSTVVALTEDGWRILRRGLVSAGELERVLS
jgi:tRNA threonylcarbamoyl adenosine modification protein (Sua5/YciO/YrdC/YwlC family)